MIDHQSQPMLKSWVQAGAQLLAKHGLIEIVPYSATHTMQTLLGIIDVNVGIIIVGFLVVSPVLHVHVPLRLVHTGGCICIQERKLLAASLCC